MGPASPYVLQTGAVIAAALITGIRSDLPGQITAQVTEHVYDSPTGRILLVPQGTRLIGEFSNVHGGDKPGHWIVGDVPMRAV
jgi:type IV secretion system protein VirB10